ncbi:MAG: GAF domain-containing protein [Hellea sp.]|nr:GAF domain-containing protein [Hellea sp.]
MLAKLHPENYQRLEALRSFAVLDSGREKTYDELTRLTADLCDAPVCLVSLVEEDRQWFKSAIGLGVEQTPIEQSICSHAVSQDEYLEIEDTQVDARTSDNSLCMGSKPFRFYAGAIIRSFDGWPLGTLCVLDYKPRQLTGIQRQVLKVHAKNVAQQLELTRELINRAKSYKNIERLPIPVDPEAKQKFDSLTPRETEIVKLVAGHSGSLSSKEIARELGISHRTVDHHRANIMAKMKVDSIAELISIIIKTGYLSR